MVTKRHLEELGYEVILVNHIDRQSAKAWASKRWLRRIKHVMWKYMFVQDVVEKKQTTPAYVEQSRLDDKTPYLRSAHERMRNAGSETHQTQGKTRWKPCEVM